MSIRQMTQTGDPMLKIMLIKELKQKLEFSAKENKRRIQDEFIRRLAATFNHYIQEDILINMTEELNHFQNIGRYAQIIPKPLMDSLQDAAQRKNFTLDQETNLRLLLSFKEGDSLNLNTLSEKILKQKFTFAQAVAECKHKRDASVYLYEIEKLSLYLAFKHRLPKTYQENFAKIDVAELADTLKQN